MYFFIYKTTNTINGKFYIGKHKTNLLDDGYLGSGKNIQRAIKKYGRDKFERIILCFCNNEDELNLKEKEIVNETLIHTPESYNIALGGQGGFDHINRLDYSEIKKQKSLDRFGTTHPMKNKIISNKRMQTINERYGEHHLTDCLQNGYKEFCKNKNVSNVMQLDYVKKKHKENLPSGHQSGSKNSQFGKRFKYVNDGSHNKKVLISKLDVYLTNGWQLGRI